MTGALQTSGWRFAGPFRSMVIVASAFSALFFADGGRCDTSPATDQVPAARLGAPGPCLADPRYVMPADAVAGASWRLAPCAREEVGTVCAECAICASCIPVKTRGIRPRSPGGGPDD